MRHFRFLVASVCTLSLGVLAGCGAEDGTTSGNQVTAPQDTTERERIEKGLVITPVPVDLTGKDRDLVGLGSYIVNAQGGCIDCHSNPPYAPGGNPFLGEPKQINVEGFLRGGMAFGTAPYQFFSPSLRPNAQGLPAGLSREEFIALMRTGLDEGRLLQVMPWPIFGNMTDRDLTAIHEYLRSLPQ
jgi:hypothetical protein